MLPAGLLSLLGRTSQWSGINNPAGVREQDQAELLPPPPTSPGLELLPPAPTLLLSTDSVELELHSFILVIQLIHLISAFLWCMKKQKNSK